MTSAVWILILVLFLSGVTACVFIILVVGIRKGDRAHRLADEPTTHLDALTRSVLGVGVRPGCPADDSHAEGA